MVVRLWYDNQFDLSTDNYLNLKLLYPFFQARLSI